MRAHRGLLIALALVGGSGALAACTLVDQYSGRAVAYNLEAEQAQEQAILLNVIRASLRRPMQFTTVSAITGSASSSGGVSYTLPTNIPFRPASSASFPPVPSWGFSTSMSGGPTFTVPVLDTQEFYQGILKPIPGQFYDLYLQQGYPQELLFNLFVQKIVMHKNLPRCSEIKSSHGNNEPCLSKTDIDPCPVTNHESQCEIIFKNYVGSEREIQLFQTLASYLVDLGLSTEATTQPKDVPLEGKVANVNLKILSSSALTAGSTSATGSTEQSGAKYYFCFAPGSSTNAAFVPQSALCGIPGRTRDASGSRASAAARGRQTAAVEAQQEETKARQLPAVDSSAPTVLQSIYLSSSVAQSLIEIANSSQVLPSPAEERDIESGNSLANVLKKHFPANSRVALTFHIRSVEGIIYYLGELARRQLYPDYNYLPRSIMIHIAPPYDKPCGERDETGRYCDYLFTLNSTLVPHAVGFVSATYNGQHFSVSDKRDGGGYSASVLEITKQLLALFSSAKSLPQTNVLSVINQ